MGLKLKTGAIVLAAGKGTRMGADIPKQYLLLKDKPVIYYALNAFEESSVDEIILVTGKDEIDYCRESIVAKYQFKKISAIVIGGEERFNSVYHGLCAMKDVDFVFIHDGARPLITVKEIENLKKEVMVHKACVAGMPVKDTIKIADRDDFVKSTPNREQIWTIQTPQVFSYELIKDAYNQLIIEGIKNVTDDAMVLERMKKDSIKLVRTSYKNIKITTPEDISIAKIFI